LYDAPFPKRRDVLKYFIMYNCLSKIYVVHNMSAPKKQRYL
jgi:hypothetical protein